MALIPVSEAQQRLLALARPRATEMAPIGACAGRWLAAPVQALRDQPWADLSAMDGYAVRAAEWPGPWTCVDESRAGTATPHALAPGQCSRIFTGAPMPPGADAVLIQENALRDGDRITASADPLPSGRHVRPRGQDFARDAALLNPGSRIGPAQIALAVLAGHGALPVRPRLRVALLSTGDELVPPGVPVPPGALPASNAAMLAAMLAPFPCDVIDTGLVPDDMDATVAALKRAAGADIIVSTGGASVGDHDLVRPAFEAVGGTLDFWKIRMRPGKPLIAGTWGDSVFLGLPGNPVSAFVTAHLFLLPLVRHLFGDPAPLPRPIFLPTTTALTASGEREEYLRAVRSDDGVTLLASQDSASSAALASADCLIVRPPNAPDVLAGAIVPTLPIRD